MPSIRKSKLINSLQNKKNRSEERLFLVEGEKSLQELLQSDSFEVHSLYITEAFAEKYGALLSALSFEIEYCKQEEIEKLGTLQSNAAGLAIVHFPTFEALHLEPTKWYLALDSVRDPGNLGTIIRIADWYGIQDIICSPDCAEVYNPKVISATMGSFTRVRWHYQELKELFQLKPKELGVYAALLEGAPHYGIKFPLGGILLMGNESKGISADLLPLVEHSVHIPRVGGAESLNVAIATAILCDALRRG